MSTNFYWKTLPKEFKGKDNSEESPYIHIGKRSGAGLYCKDCGVTLCTRGTSTECGQDSPTSSREAAK